MVEATLGRGFLAMAVGFEYCCGTSVTCEFHNNQTCRYSLATCQLALQAHVLEFGSKWFESDLYCAVCLTAQCMLDHLRLKHCLHV
jgi:hypothetical protein